MYHNYYKVLQYSIISVCVGRSICRHTVYIKYLHLSKCETTPLQVYIYTFIGLRETMCRAC